MSSPQIICERYPSQRVKKHIFHLLHGRCVLIYTRFFAASPLEVSVVGGLKPGDAGVTDVQRAACARSRVKTVVLYRGGTVLGSAALVIRENYRRFAALDKVVPDVVAVGRSIGVNAEKHGAQSAGEVRGEVLVVREHTVVDNVEALNVVKHQTLCGNSVERAVLDCDVVMYAIGKTVVFGVRSVADERSRTRDRAVRPSARAPGCAPVPRAQSLS